MARSLVPPSQQRTFKEKLQHPGRLQSRVLEVLQVLWTGQHTAFEIADKLQVQKDTVRRNLAWLEKYGIIAIVGFGERNPVNGVRPYLYAVIVPDYVLKETNHAALRVRGDGSKAYIGVRPTEDRQDRTSGQAS